MKKNYLTIILLLALQFTFAQIINIPDANFKHLLVNANIADFDGDTFPDGDVDTNNDGEIDVVEANAVLGLRIDPNSIVSLEGIASFTNIQFLECLGNDITELDLSQNVNLQILECQSNDLFTLTLGSNSNLERISFGDNSLSTIDVSGLPNLKTLIIVNNRLQTIDVSNNLLLENLAIAENQIATINISSNVNLKSVDFSFNNFTSLDFSQNPLMEHLYCAFTNLTFLDLSTNTNLKTVFCAYNLLTGLDIKNGANTNIGSFNAIDNPDLSCINVDDPAYSQSQSSWQKDATANYDTNCSSLSTEEFQTTSTVSIFPNPTTGQLYIESTKKISFVKVYNLVGQQVKLIEMRNDQKSIDMSELKTGSYFVNLQDAAGNTDTKLIVKK